MSVLSEPPAAPLSQDTLVSVVVPALNEEANLRRVHECVAQVFAELPGTDFELVITDNRSDDATYAVACELAEQDPRVRAYRFARNYGYQRSIYAAYLLAKGDCAVQLDADLQDPPELIPQMLDRWREGNLIVYGTRRSRAGEASLVSGVRRIFYALINALSEDDLPRDAGDFRLIDRTVIEVLRETYDAAPYIRGAIASMGFDQMGFEYDRRSREAGESKFGVKDMVSLAVDGMLNHSIRPLNLASWVAMITAAMTSLLFVGFLVGRLALGQDWPAGFASLVLLQLVGIIVNAAFFGILGAYLGRVFRQSKIQPFVVIEHASNGDGPAIIDTGNGLTIRRL